MVDSWKRFDYSCPPPQLNSRILVDDAAKTSILKSKSTATTTGESTMHGNEYYPLPLRYVIDIANIKTPRR
jgi:hypothetical protein